MTCGIRLGDKDRHSEKFWVDCLTLNRVQFYFKRHTLSLPGSIFGLPTYKKPRYTSTQVSQLNFLARYVQELSRHQVNCDRTQQTQQRRGLSGQKARRIKHHSRARRSVTDQGNSYRDPPKPTLSFEDAIDTNPNHGQVRHRLESTRKSAIRPTNGYTT